jgi:hypothetical protein
LLGTRREMMAREETATLLLDVSPAQDRKILTVSDRLCLAVVSLFRVDFESADHRPDN